MNIGVISLGCPKNLTDTELMLGRAVEAGHQVVGSEKDADLIIINTCAFIEAARIESNDEISRICQLKKICPEKRIIVAGCLSQREQAKLLIKWPEIDGVIGTFAVDRILDVIEDIQKNIKPILTPATDVPDQGKLLQPATLPPRLLATPSYYAYLRIAEGCNKCCTYCIIPKLRGEYRSRPLEAIVEEAKQLAEIGVKELNLIAQDTTEYGQDLYGKKLLPVLLAQLEQIPGIHWIRLLYAYPEGITDDLVQFFKNSAKMCHYLDMPIQHADDEILKKMGRPSRAKDIRRLVKELRSEIPDIALRTSVIVGFPGETEQNFENLCEFIQDVKFDRLGVFEYSKEEGTPAARLAGQIEPKVKQDRYKRVGQIQTRISKMMNKAFIGKTMEVLLAGAEGGRSFRDAPDIDGNVLCPNDLPAGTFAKVLISQALTYDLKGQVLGSG
jgi:ribosomal protein S12 methylthiotransferase